MIRRLLLVAPLLLCVGAAPAFASDPHHEETDGCDRGNTSKECRPDPSENGKDCLPHGKHGGVNEDHCLSTSTTQPPTTTTTTLTTPTTTITVQTEFPSSPTTATNTRFGFPTISTASPSTLAAELPRTGWDAGLLFVVGFSTFCAGLSTWFAAKVL